MRRFSKVYIAFAIGAGLSIAVAFTSISIGSPLPENLKLKADRSKILSAKTLRNGDVRYAYQSDVKVSDSPSQDVLSKASKQGMQVNGEIVEKRTKNSRTFTTNQPGTFITEIISGEPQYYKDQNNEWWEVDYATTTGEAFNEQAQVSFLDRMFGMKAIAATTTDIIFPDQNNPGIDTADGEIGVNARPSWASAHDAGVGDGIDTTSPDFKSCAFQAANSAGSYYVKRLGFIFDTSFLGSSAIISSATFSAYGGSGGSANDDGTSVQLVQNTWANEDTYSTDDFDQFGTTLQSDTSINISSWTTAGYNDFPLNSTGLSNINKTGVTKLGLRVALDVSNTSPTGADYQYAFMSENNGHDKDPKLVITYSVPLTTKAQKPSNESVARNTTLHGDKDLALNLAANKAYIFDAVVFASSTSATPDIKISFSLPSGATMDYGYIAASSAFRNAEFLQNSAVSSSIPIAANDTDVIQIHGVINMGANSGNVQLQWAQSTSNAAPTTVIKGSYLRADSI
jgi:hypothetical protein